MKKRIVSILLAVCLVAGLCSVLGIEASAYSTGYPNTHTNTGDQRSDMVQIAQTQLGYAEDPGTKYGAWWGELHGQGDKCVNNPWCVYFVHWCLDQAGCTAGYSGLSGESSSLLGQYLSGKNGNAAYKFGSGYMPRPGDLIFVGTGKNATAPDHVGLIVSVDGDTIYTVEGNYSDKVSRSSYSLSTGNRSNSVRTILYFGVPAYANDSEAGFDGPVVTPPEPETPETPETGINYTTTVKTGLNVRTSADTTSTVITSLSAGTEVTIVDEANGNNGHRWGKLSTGGWICLYYTTAGDAGSGTELAPTEPEAPAETPIEGYEATVNCDILNMRSGAGTGNPVVGQLYRGDKVKITTVSAVDNQEWGKTADGWVATQYLTKVEAPAAPETPAEPEAPETPSAAISGTITASVLNIRSTPGTGSVIGAYYRGEAVEITETTTVNGKSWGKTSAGWISMEYVKTAAAETPTTPETPDAPVTPTEGTACTVTGTIVNVRSGAGTGNPVTTTVTKGASITIVETATVSGSAWGRLSSGGWICLQYTDYSGTSAPVEPVNPDTPAEGGTPAAITGTITASVLNVRSTPGTGSVIGACYKGQTVEITETQTVDGTTWGKTSAGWVSMDYVSSGSTGNTGNGGTASGTACTVKADVVNVRSGAGTGNPVTTTVTKGTTVTIVATTTGSDGRTWGQLASGGWVCMDYVN